VAKNPLAAFGCALLRRLLNRFAAALIVAARSSVSAATFILAGILFTRAYSPSSGST
jgi:hypothetical protein